MSIAASSGQVLPRLLILTPSRGRPAGLRRLADACKATCRGDTTIAVGLDTDDVALDGYRKASSWPRVATVVTGPRNTLTGWTNELAKLHLSQYEFFASIGDDHVPSTPGWDTKFMDAITAMGGTGFAYGDDKSFGPDLPTAWVVSANIVRALGWVCNPVCGHFCIDNVIRDLGEGADCLAYLPGVTIEHLHHTTGKSAPDRTYLDAGGFHTGHPDYLAYLRWQREQMATDIITIKTLMA